MNAPATQAAVVALSATCPDPDQIIKAIRHLHCDPLTVREILGALSSRYAEWLSAEDIDVIGNDGLRLMDEAQDALGDFGDWHHEASRERARLPLASIEREAWPLPGGVR